MKEGRIIKAVSGFYYVKVNDHIYTCKGRGVFRKRKITPLVGDIVRFEVTSVGEGYITYIEPRKNELNRPPIANIDQAIVVASATMPDFSAQLLDRFLVGIESVSIEPIIFITKKDLIDEETYDKIQQYKKDYEKIGYSVEFVVAKENSSLKHLYPYFEQKISVITGQSGVGKSSLLNALNPELLIETDEISKSLGRGKHTTRYVELLEIKDGLVADTPGFSSIDFDHIEIEELPDCFPEMRKRKDECRFRGCLHIKEPSCAIKNAVEQGSIPKYRYDHYIDFSQEILNRKPRYS